MVKLQRLQLFVLGLCTAMLAACGGGSDPFYRPPDGGSGTQPPFGTTEPVKRPAIASLPSPVRTAPAGPRVLVLYDEPENDEFAKLGIAYGILVRNLLGHFDAAVEAVPMGQYRKAAINGYQTTFYIGWSSESELPVAFLEDVATTSRRVIWVRDNLQQLADFEGAGFQSRLGIATEGPRAFDPGPTPPGTAPSFFSTVHYKNMAFEKSATVVNGVVEADPVMFATKVTDPAKARVHAVISNPATRESAPYVLQSGNFWFVADLPFNYYTPRDRYVVFSDLLHDMLGIDHAENHRAMVRLEDIDAKVNPEAFKKTVDYLYSKGVPFSLAVIPHYKDPYGAQSGGVPTDIPMAQATNLRLALDYALARGGEILQHGTTHQSEDMINNVSGASGIDYEFWDMVHDKPLPGDAVPWARDRINAGLRQLLDLGYLPVAWETPHYVGSPSTLLAVEQIYQTAYQRHMYYTSDHPNLTPGMGADFGVDQFAPYIMERDIYGLRVLPETLGNLQYVEFGADEELTSKELLENARYLRAVRDGFASFFVHPFLMVPAGAYDGRGYRDLTEIVEGLTAMGYSWTSPSRLGAPQ